MRRGVQNQSRLHEEETGDGEENEDEEMRPGPGNAQIFRQRWTRSVGRESARGVADGIASEPGVGIFGWGRLGGTRDSCPDGWDGLSSKRVIDFYSLFCLATFAASRSPRRRLPEAGAVRDG